MTDDQHQPRTADEIPEWELEEMIREAIRQSFRDDITERALAWLDKRFQRSAEILTRSGLSRAGFHLSKR
jgi:hypothetical protein